MNESTENFLIACSLLNKKIHAVSTFESRRYEVNRISNIVFLGVLIIPTVLLNAVAVITIWKTAQLKKKPCYFVILLQSSVDLGVGCIALPIFLVALLVPFTNIDICTPVIVSNTVTVFAIGLSTLILSALTVERYIAVVHPYSYRRLVTKRRIVIFVLGGGSIQFPVVVACILNEYLTIKYAAMGFFATFLIFTSFAYIRMYLVMQRLSRSEVRPNEVGGEENKKRRRALRSAVKHAMSAFIVVIFFFVLLVPFTLFPVFIRMGKMNFNAYLMWSGTLIFLNSTVNSVIYFWRVTALRQEAIKILKNSLTIGEFQTFSPT